MRRPWRHGYAGTCGGRIVAYCLLHTSPRSQSSSGDHARRSEGCGKEIFGSTVGSTKNASTAAVTECGLRFKLSDWSFGKAGITSDDVALVTSAPKQGPRAVVAEGSSAPMPPGASATFSDNTNPLALLALIR